MAVAIEMNYPGATLAQYDEVIKIMGATPGGLHPDGALFHWIAKTDDGFRVVDVWESKEQFERFVQEKIGPLGEQLGMAKPEMRFVDIYNYLTG